MPVSIGSPALPLWEYPGTSSCAKWSDLSSTCAHFSATYRVKFSTYSVDHTLQVLNEHCECDYAALTVLSGGFGCPSWLPERLPFHHQSRERSKFSIKRDKFGRGWQRLKDLFSTLSLADGARLKCRVCLRQQAMNRLGVEREQLLSRYAQVAEGLIC